MADNHEKSNFVIPSCQIPFTWLEIDTQQQKIRSCCKTNFIKPDSNDFFNHQKIIQRRKDFLNGSRSLDCKHCWGLEDHGQVSYRQYTNNYSCFRADNYNLIQSIPKTLSINFGSICNLACSYCNEEYSSRWAAEKRISLKDSISKDFEDQVLQYISKNIQSDNLVQINLIGGEPTINPLFYYFLDILPHLIQSRSTPIKIVIQTNGMFNNAELDKILTSSKIDNCDFVYRFSIEAIGKISEYIRTGLRWDKFETNFRALLEQSKKQANLFVTVHPTLNVLALENLPEFLSWLDNLNYDRWLNFGMNHVESPKGLSLRNLGYLTKEFINTCTYKHKVINNYANSVNNFLLQFTNIPTSADLEEIKNEYIKAAIRSNIKYQEAVPKLSSLIENYK